LKTTVVIPTVPTTPTAKTPSNVGLAFSAIATLPNADVAAIPMSS
jgi:hypothetical protein